MTASHLRAQRWKLLRARAVLLAGLAGLPCAAWCGTLPLVDALRELDSPGGMDSVARVQLLHIDYSVEYRSAVSEHFIEQNAPARCEMPFTAPLRTEFLLTLHAAAPQTTDQGADLRWSAIFLDRQGIPVHRISANGRYFIVGLGRLGYLDGIAVAFEPGIGEWFERTLANCLKSTRHD